MSKTLKHFSYFLLTNKLLEEKQLIDILEYQIPQNIIDRFNSKYNLSHNHLNKVIIHFKLYFSMFIGYKTKHCSMNSFIVDELWHIYLLYTKEYSHFCKSTLGFYLHHVPDNIQTNEDQVNKNKSFYSTYNSLSYLNQKYSYILNKYNIYPNQVFDIYQIDKELNVFK